MIPNQWLLKTKIDIDKVNSLAEQGEYALIDHGDRSTSGDKSKQWAFSDANLLFDFVIEELKKANPEKHLYDMDLLRKGSAWIVEGQEGSYHRMHRHTRTSLELHRPNDKNLATVIYTDVPEDENKGEFYFIMKKEKDIIIDSIIPEKGDFFIMPCTVWHGVYPQGAGLRRTINVDFYYDSKKQN